MSRETLVNEYVAGRISRRTLIRRLLGAGVGFGAAVSYAHLLSPARAPARALRGGHPSFTADIIEEDLDKILRKRRVKVRVSSQDATFVEVNLRLIRPNDPDYPNVSLGRISYSPSGPDERVVRFPIENFPGDIEHPYARTALKQRKRAARLAVQVFASGDLPTGPLQVDETVVRR